MLRPINRRAPRLYSGDSVLPKVPRQTDCYMATQCPGFTAEERQKTFAEMARVFGFDGAVEYFKTTHDDLQLGITPIGVRPAFFFLCCSQYSDTTHLKPDYPPPDADLRVARIGDSPLAILYHTTYPAAVKRLGPLMWTFYIGLNGHGQESIMLEAEREKRGVRLWALDVKGQWQEFTLFQVLLSTRVRIEYPPDLRRPMERRMVELIFPAEPSKLGPIPVQLLL
ncbi:hypothetical protein C8F01DRAFT_1153905 [Mycena amicta]|nr:hypothetical protein C8F01DRAFT_1153905 [Mycena amicta]